MAAAGRYQQQRAAFAPREGRYLGVAFSPDNNYVYFGYAESGRNDAGQIFRLPVLGIGAAAMKNRGARGPAFALARSQANRFHSI